MNLLIENNEAKQRFEIQIENLTGYITYVQYDDYIDYTHTIVPNELGGRGIGTDLVKYGLAFARVHHLKVKPSCSFVAALIEKNKVYQDLLLS